MQRWAGCPSSPILADSRCLKCGVAELQSTRSPGGSSHEIRDSWPPSSEGTRCNASANPICAFLMPAIRLIDTRVASHKGHYVNRSVRGFRPPSSRRISSACFRPSRLRMRHIIRPRVVAPAIQSTPVAAHSVATIAHLAFSLAGTILIPDCPRPSAFRPRSSRSSRRLLFTVAGVVGPDLPHGELPALQLTTQPFLHRLGAQHYGAAGARRGQAMQGAGVRQAYRVPTHHTVVGVTPPQASITNRQTIISSVSNNRCTVGSSRRPMTRIRQGRIKPLDCWSGILSPNRSDATAANSGSTK